MHKALFFGVSALAIVVGGTLLDPGMARAQLAVRAVPPPVAADVVRIYFEAFRRQDAATLGSVTAGPAAADTRRMLETIQTEAARHDVGVELQVKDLAVAPAPAPPAVGDPTPVDVRFSIAVIAKKWLFSKVARRITGNAIFFVGKDRAAGDRPQPKIVGIEFAFN